jgi:hypothetical protein
MDQWLDKGAAECRKLASLVRNPELSMWLLRRNRHLERPYYRTEFVSGLKMEESADRQRAKSTIFRL